MGWLPLPFSAEQQVDEIVWTLTESEIRELMPVALKEMAGVASQRSALLIAAEFGGTRKLFCSAVSGTSREIVDLIGADNADRLAFHYGSELVGIPTMFRLVRKVRHRKIARLRAQGYPVSHIARVFELTERAVYLALKQEKRNERERLRSAHSEPPAAQTPTDQRSKP